MASAQGYHFFDSVVGAKAVAARDAAPARIESEFKRSPWKEASEEARFLLLPSTALHAM